MNRHIEYGPLIDLILIALGLKDPSELAQMDRDEWKSLYEMARKQSILGLTMPALDSLPQENGAPLSVYTKWALAVEKIRDKNNLQQQCCKRIHDKFLEYGFRSCILKGQSAGYYYPDSSLRQCGDIDIWLDGDRDRVVAFLRSLFKVKKVVYHHCDVVLLKDFPVEVHFTPSWMCSFPLNKRLQRYFGDCKEMQFSNLDPTAGYCHTTTDMDAVYLVCHVFRHMLEEGIGLRQILDCFFMLKHTDREQRDKAASVLSSLGLKKFSSGLMYILHDVFCLEEDYLLFPPNPSVGGFLMDEIMAAGNFGKYDPRNAHKLGEGIISHAIRKTKRAMRFLGIHPREVLATPFFMAWMYFWRRSKGYLYKGR